MDSTELIFSKMKLDDIPKDVENDIKWIIYNNPSMKYFNFDFITFFNIIMNKCFYFGFNKIQSCEIFIFYCNYTYLLSVPDFKLEDLVIMDYYGCFSDEVRYHIQELKYNSSLSILHNNNIHNYYVIELKDIIRPYVNLKKLDILVTYIMWVNDYHHTDIQQLREFILNIIENKNIFWQNIIKKNTCDVDLRDLCYDILKYIDCEEAALY